MLDGGDGSDILWGGDGADTFAFHLPDLFIDSQIGGLSDRIVDFVRGTDMIDLTAIDANRLVSDGNQAFTFIGAAEFSGTRGELRTYVADDVNFINYLAGDIDGDGRADFVIDLGAVRVEASDIWL